MSSLQVSMDGSVATITLRRGRVNAINEELVKDLTELSQGLAQDDEVKAVVLTGHGAFFSFGFDIPGFMSYSPQDFTRYLLAFTHLYTELFTYPKPVIAALNGHAIAGACMLALACDRRIMTRGKGKIGLNEISFGASVFAGSVELLRCCVGQRAAEQVLLTGAMYDADTALSLGLVDQVTEPGALLPAATALAEELGARDPAAYQSVKRLLRGPVAREMRERERASVQEFVGLWYANEMRARLAQIKIRD